ncbi:MAG: hypothetical protein Q7R45_03520, partial [Sulfuricaulis sp.]|nr:hypothetical protein [Sulfuricaulis sp.]
EALRLFGELRGAPAPFGQDGAEACARDWYWTSTQYASNADSAWCQTFLNGFQYYYLKSSSLRARAVRRVKI